MTPGEIIQYCQQQGVSLRVKGSDHLHYKGPSEVVTQEFVKNLRNHKWELISILGIMEVFEGSIEAKYPAIH